MTGSITHCDGYRAAAVAHSADLPHLGIDAEPHAPPARRRPRRHHHPHRTHPPPGPRHHPPRHPLGPPPLQRQGIRLQDLRPARPRPLQFDDAEITFTPTTGTFIARLLLPWPADVPAPVLPGRWHASHGILLTATTLPRPA
ncbi:hypothetical protein [Streptomyces sp. A1-5]|uniref:hypothetical protein n=1 Tax=Streptomyces sp. A1-5 TaxID=2738410 RepID=UPI002E2016AB